MVGCERDFEDRDECWDCTGQIIIKLVSFACH